MRDRSTIATMFNIKRFLWLVGVAAIAACGGSQMAERQPAPAIPLNSTTPCAKSRSPARFA
jgi:hypothetical protein